MTVSPPTAAERTADVAGLAVRMLRDGSGSPLLALHHSTGPAGWLDLHARLAASFDVIAPDMPGYGHSQRPEWAREPRDLAVLLVQLLDEEGLDDVTLVGCGLGGFVAAEMATMAQRRLRRLVLVGAAGIRPRDGEITDAMMSSFAGYARSSFRDDESAAAHLGDDPSPEVRGLWEASREMTARITWKPYMFSLRLPHLLRGVRTPAIVVSGRHDRIVPLDCAHQYAEALPNARLEIVEDAGHLVEVERPDVLAKLIGEA